MDNKLRGWSRAFVTNVMMLLQFDGPPNFLGPLDVITKTKGSNGRRDLRL